MSEKRETEQSEILLLPEPKGELVIASDNRSQEMAMQRAWGLRAPSSRIMEYILHTVGELRELESKLSIVQNMVSPSVSLARESKAQARPID